MEMAVSMVEARRRKQGSNGSGGGGMRFTSGQQLSGSSPSSN